MPAVALGWPVQSLPPLLHAGATIRSMCEGKLSGHWRWLGCSIEPSTVAVMQGLLLLDGATPYPRMSPFSSWSRYAKLQQERCT